jgi:hypothetical protein
LNFDNLKIASRYKIILGILFKINSLLYFCEIFIVGSKIKIDFELKTLIIIKRKMKNNVL